MKAVITGGGTGGHIYPALAIAEELKNRGWEILYLGSDYRMEAEIVPDAGYNFKSLTVRPLPRSISLKIPSVIFNNIRALLTSFKAIKKFNADIVIGTGGFVAGPAVLAAVLLGKKTLIHEQNAYPGITNKLLARLVDIVCLNFKEAEKFLNVKEKDKIKITGNPVRPSILNVDENLAYQKLGLSEELKTILITGGSLGAGVINKNLIKVYKYALANKIQILHLTGKKNYEEVIKRLENNNINPNNPLLNIIDYLNHMEYALSAADLIISRAGATALAEITSCGLPAILIPFAAAAENHQLFNAETLSQKNAAVIIKESELDENILLNKVKKIIEDPEKINSMSKEAEKLSQKDSLTNIIKIIESEIF